jgi:hypothetical protein
MQSTPQAISMEVIVQIGFYLMLGISLTLNICALRVAFQIRMDLVKFLKEYPDDLHSLKMEIVDCRSKIDSLSEQFNQPSMFTPQRPNNWDSLKLNFQNIS